MGNLGRREIPRLLELALNLQRVYKENFRGSITTVFFLVGNSVMSIAKKINS